mgnify:CR=1 FL=1
MATINVINTVECIVQGGNTISGKQGLSTDTATDPVEITIDGDAHAVPGTLATATAVTIYDDDNDVPIDFDYMFIWTSVDMYLQIIGATGNVVFHLLAEVPFVLSYDDFLAVGNTTPLSGAAPTTEDIDSIVLQNNSGGSGKYLAIFYS